MKSTLKIMLGLGFFMLAVFQPLRANVLAAITVLYQLDPQDKVTLLNHAATLDHCETNILNALGDAHLLSRNAMMAAMVYGKAMQCSNANSALRFKYGEAVLMMGYDGRFSIKDALTLEPSNPFYRSELERINTALLSQSQ